MTTFMLFLYYKAFVVFLQLICIYINFFVVKKKLKCI